MRRSLVLGVASGFAAAAFVLAAPREAKAGPHLGIDLDLGTAFQRQVDFSYGLGGRFGYKIHFPGNFFWLLPEGGGHYMRFGTGNSLGGFAQAGEVFGGVRFGLGGLVQPNIFSHLGLGFVGNSQIGPAADIGVGVDFQITRIFTLGLQVAYNAVTVTSSGDAAKWVNFGLNFGFDFFGRPRRHDRRR